MRCVKKESRGMRDKHARTKENRGKRDRHAWTRRQTKSKRGAMKEEGESIFEGVGV